MCALRRIGVGGLFPCFFRDVVSPGLVCEVEDGCEDQPPSCKTPPTSGLCLL